jgi:hypothetical protein
MSMSLLFGFLGRHFMFYFFFLCGFFYGSVQYLMVCPQMSVLHACVESTFVSCALDDSCVYDLRWSSECS